MANRTDAFVSYSHADQAWLQRIKVHLRPLERDHGVVIWQDTNLRGGQRWRQEIDEALDKAKVAILLISPDFLASDFIHNNELPPLLEAAEKDGLMILSVIVSACAFDRSPLSEFQAINTPDTPLDLLSAGEVNRVLVRLFRRVDELFAASIVTPRLDSSKKAADKLLEKEAIESVKSKTKPQQSELLTPPDSSTAPLALIVKSDGQWETVAVTFSEIGNGELILTLQPSSPMQRAFLTSLNQRGELNSIVYNEQTYSCKLHALNSFTEGGKSETWKLSANIKELSRPQDMTFNDISPLEQAQSKARLLLLNERPEKGNSRSPFSFLMSVPEGYISPLFVLYHAVQRDAKRFQQVAPLIAAWYLQTGGIVKDIFRLNVRLQGKKQFVDFEGQRYANYEDPAIVKIKGQCEIPDYLPAEALPLRLLKQSNLY